MQPTTTEPTAPEKPEGTEAAPDSDVTVTLPAAEGMRYRGPRRHPRLVALLVFAGLVALLAVSWVLLGQPRQQAQQTAAWEQVRHGQLAEAAPIIQRYRLQRTFYNSIRTAFDASAATRLAAATDAIAATNELAAIGALRGDRYFGAQEATRVDLLHAAATAHDRRILATLDELIAQHSTAAAFALLDSTMQSDAGRTALRHYGPRLYDLQAIQVAAAAGHTPTVLALIERNPIPAFQQFRRMAFDANRDRYTDITNLDELAPLAGRQVAIAGTIGAAPAEQAGTITIATFRPDRRKAPTLQLRFSPGCTTLAALQQAGITRGARVTFYGVLDLQQQRQKRLLWFDRTRTTLALSPVAYWIPSPTESP